MVISLATRIRQWPPSLFTLKCEAIKRSLRVAVCQELIYFHGGGEHGVPSYNSARLRRVHSCSVEYQTNARRYVDHFIQVIITLTGLKLYLVLNWAISQDLYPTITE